jgi:hypothetical protein
VADLTPQSRVAGLTPWSRTLLGIAGSTLAGQKIPRILWNSKLHFPIHKISPPPVAILSQITSIHNRVL